MWRFKFSDALAESEIAKTIWFGARAVGLDRTIYARRE
jgi:hypothetical protein